MSSALLVQDAHIDGERLAAPLERVALDEFTQSAFEGAKFQTLPLLRGRWTFEMVLEIDMPKGHGQAEALQLLRSRATPVLELLKAAGQRRIAVGGGRSGSFGHLEFVIHRTEWAVAGQDWMDPQKPLLAAEAPAAPGLRGLPDAPRTPAPMRTEPKAQRKGGKNKGKKASR